MDSKNTDLRILSTNCKIGNTDLFAYLFQCGILKQLFRFNYCICVRHLGECCQFKTCLIKLACPKLFCLSPSNFQTSFYGSFLSVKMISQHKFYQLWSRSFFFFLVDDFIDVLLSGCITILSFIYRFNNSLLFLFCLFVFSHKRDWGILF